MTKTVKRAISILEFLSNGPQHPRLIAQPIDGHRTTAPRLIIQDLVNGGLAPRDQDGALSVRCRLTGLAKAAMKRFELGWVQ
jgi:DNA-binding IclR family transcriptional regulator